MASSGSGDIGRRGTLLLLGFYGRGNAGDEALLQCACEAFEDAFDIAIAVDEHGAYPGFWDWYPYAGRRIVHQQDLGFVHRTRDLRGVLVGGGGLPFGFGADMILEAASRGIPVAVAGVDVPRRAEILAAHHPALIHAYRDALAAFTVRSAASADTARRAGLRATHGADFALRLPTDAAAEVRTDPGRALVVVREWPQDEGTPAYAGEVRDLLDALRDAGLSPSFLPFAPEDTRFLGESALADLAPTIESWWNPRRLKQLIASSALVVAIGRLHPIVFAATTTTPVASIGVPRPRGRRTPRKSRDLSIEFGISHFDALGPLCTAIGSRTIGPADPALVAAATERLDQSIAELRRAFGAPPA